MHKTSIILFFIISGLLSSCNMFSGRGSDQPVARVKNKYLYKSDLDGIVGPGTHPSDSAAIINRYIENWVRQQIFVAEAEQNLSDDRKDFQRKVEDYRNSLIIFTYENQLVKSNLDTVISPELMAEYYEKHKDEFKLRDNIVQVRFIKLPLDAPNVNQVRRFIRSENEDDLLALEEYSLNHAASFYLEEESWFLFSDILRDIPINPQNHESFLRNNRFIERNDNYYRYFLYIKDYRLEGSPSPIAYQSDNIRAIILNKRKMDLINEYRQETYKQAVGNGTFEIFQ